MNIRFLVPLTLVCAGASAWAAETVVDPCQFGAKPDGQTLCTEPIQKAIDACAAAGGGSVVLAGGKFLSGTISLRSHVTLHIEEGSMLLGSTDIAHYPHHIPAIRSYTDSYVKQSLIAGETGVGMSGVRRLESLRALYELRAKLMDPAGLRSALMLGVKYNDDLARTLLLDHLSAAPPSPQALGALGALADETAQRIGPMGAVRIALAYAHLGDVTQAAIWAKRGAEGPRGIPAGLLDLSGGGALHPGRISGRRALSR